MFLEAGKIAADPNVDLNPFIFITNALAAFGEQLSSALARWGGGRALDAGEGRAGERGGAPALHGGPPNPPLPPPFRSRLVVQASTWLSSC